MYFVTIAIAHASMRRLSSKIETPSGPASIDSFVAYNQTDPRACDLRIGQIDVLPDQLCCALAPRIDESSARAIVPVEREIDRVVRRSHFGATLFPFVRGVSRDGRIRAAVPPARPMSFDRGMRSAIACGRPGFGICIVTGSSEPCAGGELRHVAA